MLGEEKLHNHRERKQAAEDPTQQYDEKISVDMAPSCRQTLRLEYFYSLEIKGLYGIDKFEVNTANKSDGTPRHTGNNICSTHGYAL